MQNHSVVILISESNKKNKKKMWKNLKFFAALAVIASCFLSVNTQTAIKPVTDADYEVLLNAIEDPTKVTPVVLQHSIFRILASFLPPFPRPAAP